VVTTIFPTHPFSYWATSHINTRVATGTFQTFTESLTHNHVGLQHGSCSLNTIGPDSGLFEITWYGKKGLRSSTFSIRFNGQDVPPCTSEVADLYRAIQAIGNAVGANLGAGARSQ
jgi:hypothetical protein